MKPYHRNPRQITKKRVDTLTESLDRLGDLGGIVHNIRTDEIIGGNQRTAVFGEASEVHITERYDKPDRQGTVAHGYIVWRGGKYSYRQVDWDEDTAAEANIRANVGAGDWDWNVFANQWEPDKLVVWGLDSELQEALGRDYAALGNMLESEEEDENYSRKIEPPTYEPTSEKPTIGELYDAGKTRELIEGIEGAEGVSDEERAFLKIAAERHTVFNFKKIADYYACSEPPVQFLMENSALVIIDFSRAIQCGFVELTKNIAEMVKDEYGDD